MQTIKHYIDVSVDGMIECAGSIAEHLLDVVPVTSGCTRHIVGKPTQPGEHAYFDFATEDIVEISNNDSRKTFDFKNKVLVFDTDKAEKELYQTTQRYLDRKARENGNWSSMLSARTAANSGSKFASQARPLSLLYDDVWDFYYKSIDVYKNNLKPWPSCKEFEASLPGLE